MCAQAHAAVKETCCYCCKSASKQLHHAVYSDGLGSILGREIVGVHVFPVCLRCHGKLHRKGRWIVYNDRSLNRNRKSEIERLQLGFQLLSQGLAI